MSKNERIFWNEDFIGNAQGGFFIRTSKLVDFLNKCEEHKRIIVGINIDMDEPDLIEVILNAEENTENTL